MQNEPGGAAAAEIDLAGDLVAGGWRDVKSLTLVLHRSAAVAVAALLVEEEGAAGVDLAERHAAGELGAVERPVRHADRELHP